MKIIFTLLLFFASNICLSQNPIEKTFELINYNRKINGLNSLVWNDKLEKAAKSHSNWMAQVGMMVHLRGNKPASFFELQNAEHHPVDRIIKAGYYPIEKIYKFSPNQVNSIENADDFWGEIIAHGKPGGNRSYPYRSDIVVDGWMKSPGHKAQILKPTIEEMAVALTATPNGDVFWCVVFGKQ